MGVIGPRFSDYFAGQRSRLNARSMAAGGIPLDGGQASYIQFSLNKMPLIPIVHLSKSS